MVKTLRISLLAACLLPLTGCLFRSHRVEQVRMSTASLQQATADQLTQELAYAASRFQTLDAQVDIAPSVGGAKKGKVTDYTDIHGYILLRKPAMLRMIGLFPVVRNRAFDMVSDGETFRASIPPKNKFFVGRNDVSYDSQQGFSALRPQAILDALLVRPVDPASEIAVLESGTEMVVDPKSHRQVEEPDYILIVSQHSAEGWRLARKIYFNREDLEPARQVLYDASGNIATDAHYAKYTNYSSIAFPAEITIDRPVQEYTIVLKVETIKFNTPLTDAQFQLPQPPGSQLVRLDVPPGKPAVATPPAASAPPAETSAAQPQ